MKKHFEYSSKTKIILVMLCITLCLFWIIWISRLPYLTYSSNALSFEPLNIDYNQLDFAGEKVIVDTLSNPLWREKLEQELVTTHLEMYQILLFHKYAHKYFPFIETYFHEIGIPLDFKYLAVAESGLKLTAESHAGARGIWQLMPETARRFGLRVDEHIDERLHFENSTRVAGAYLKQIYPLFHNWTLTAAAYNRWESWLQRDLLAQPNAKNYYDLVLNEETGNYVYRIIAIKYLMKNIWKLFSHDVLESVFDAPETKIRVVEWPILDLRNWCFLEDIDYQELRNLNPWILGYTLPGWVWEVKLLVR